MIFKRNFVSLVAEKSKRLKLAGVPSVRAALKTWSRLLPKELIEMQKLRRLFH